MPVIMFEGGKMERDKKSALVKNLTAAAVETLGIPEQAFTIIIKENDFDNIAVGGKLFSEGK